MLPEVTQWTGLFVAFPLLGVVILLSHAVGRFQRSSLADAQAALAAAREDAREDRERYQRDRESWEQTAAARKERCDALEARVATLHGLLRDAGISWPG